VSPRAPRLASEDMCRLLEREGFALVSQKGSHRKYRHPDGRMTIVPMGKDPLRPGTQADILRQAGISAL
jgi:predicted RNA binding protein YcfA (HicA-like mRNA interferase family)